MKRQDGSMKMDIGATRGGDDFPKEPACGEVVRSSHFSRRGWSFIRLLTAMSKISFRKRFFGHYHNNAEISEKEILLYEQMMRIS